MTRKKKDSAPASAQADGGATRKRGTNPFKYLQEVRNEAKKVTWTGWSELRISTIMVLVLSLIAMLFFWGVDSIIQFVINRLLSLGA